MDINSTLTNRRGEKLKVEYHEDADPMVGLEGKKLHAVHAFCICDGKMVLVNHPKIGWQPPGGGIEPGETIEEATAREVHEETNMKVLSQKIIGWQDVYDTDGTKRQIRSFCIVEPYGPFVSDPDGEIQEIKMIDPKDYRKYFDWKVVGDRIMERYFEFLKENDNK